MVTMEKIDKVLEDYTLEEIDNLIKELQKEVEKLQKEVIEKNKKLAELLNLYKNSN